MKNIRRFCIFAAGVLLAAASAARAAGSDGAPLDGIVVVVNDQVITYLQVNDAIIKQIHDLQRAYLPQDPNTYYAKAQQFQKDELELMERSKLILDDYSRGEYSTNWLDDALAQAMKDDLKDRGITEAKLILTLRTEGKTKEQYTKEMRDRVIVQALASFHTGNGKIVISPAAVEQFYKDHNDDFKIEDQIKLHTIAIPQAAGSPPGSAKEIATEILRKIDAAGVPFSEMAKVYTSGPSRSAAGEWIPRKELIAPLRDAAFSLKAGEHSQVLELTDERSRAPVCYILMVDEIRPAHISPLTEVQGQIEQVLKAQRGKALEDQWIERLKAKSLIRTF